MCPPQERPQFHFLALFVIAVLDLGSSQPSLCHDPKVAWARQSFLQQGSVEVAHSGPKKTFCFASTEQTGNRSFLGLYSAQACGARCLR